MSSTPTSASTTASTTARSTPRGASFTGLGTGIGKVSGFIGKALTAAAIGGVAAIGAGLTAAAISGIKYNSTIQQTTIAMGTMLGSTRKARDLIAEVTELLG